MKNKRIKDLSYDRNFENIMLEKTIESSTPCPDKEKIDLTISMLEQYLPTKINKTSIANDLSILLKIMKNISLVSKMYWLTSFAIYLLGLLLTLFSKNPSITIMFFSPIPFIMMFFEDIKGREPEVLEMELACKYSPQVIMLSRFIIIAFYNIITMTTIVVLLNYYILDGILFNIIFAWLTPLTIVSNITLLLIKKLKTSYTLSVIVLLWMSLILWLINTPPVMDALYHLNIGFYSLLIIIGIILLAIQMKDYIQKNTERSMLFES